MEQCKLIDITGKTFGKWTVIKRAENDKYKSARWLCRCECGNEHIVRGADLRSGKSKNCGCVNKNNFKKMIYKHGREGTRLYRTWSSIKARCYNKNYHKYYRYGGRGITVCDEWKNDFMSFYKWAMANGYKDNLTIDRIDNDGNYEPNNCRWVTNKEQANNKSTNVFVEYKGLKKTVAEWSRYFNCDYEKLRVQIHKNNIQEVFEKLKLKDI